jgi:pimeloyl-ACP methyl ester carboxylesterase
MTTPLQETPDMNPAALPFLLDRRRAAPAAQHRTTVLLLHASASSARQWQALAEALQPRWQVLTLDFHGHGERAAWRGAAPLTLADDAALATSLLAEAGGGHVVGHSYGGAVALKLASQWPWLVRSVVAYEPVLVRLLMDHAGGRDVLGEAVAIAEGIRERLARDQDEAAARLFVEYWSGPGAWALMPLGRRAAVVMRMSSVLRQYDALVREPVPLAQLAPLRLPMLMLSGERSVRTTRRIAALLRAGLPQAQHEVLPGLDHMSPITRPESFNRRVLRFLATQAAADTPPPRLAAAG